jgi:hypothetical protein
MPSTAETYRDAATEHLRRASDLYDQDGIGNWFLIHYLSGLAVECHLRAYARRRSPDFEPRHDLVEIAKEADFDGILNSKQTEVVSEKLAVINQRWRSNQRYNSEGELAEYLNGIRAEFNKKGDTRLLRCRLVFNYATDIIEQGEQKWASWTRR